MARTFTDRITITNIETGHTDFHMLDRTRAISITSIAFISDHEIVCGKLCDNKPIVWNFKDNLFYTLEDHQSYATVVCKLETLDGVKACTGSDDQTIKMWDLETKECTQTIPDRSCTNEKHLHTIRTIFPINPNKILSGSTDGTARVWDTQTGKCLTCLDGKQNNITSVVAYKEYLITGDNKGLVSIWYWPPATLQNKYSIPGYFK